MKTIYTNGKVFTGLLPLQQAFCVEEGRFRAVGTNEAVMRCWKPGDRICSLEGSFVCPGFNDSHMHVLNYGFALEQCDLSVCTGSLAQMQAGLAAFLRDNPPGENGWLRGRGWNQDYFTPATGIPTRYDLDAVTGDHPVCIVRCCGHCLVVNSRGLEVLGLDERLPQPEGGSYDVDDRGKMTGVFRDTAMSYVYARLGAPGREDLKRMLRRAIRKLNSCGITSCHSDDLCAFESLPWEEVVLAYRELEEAGELTLRVYEQSQFTTPEALQTFFDRGYTTGWGTDRFRIGPLKLLGDGSLGARTAYLSQAYADAPRERGLAIFTEKEFENMLCLARKNGMQIAIHAIGDGILDRILDAYGVAFSRYPASDHRCGIVHAQITRPDQLEKMRKLDLHAYVQTVFLDYDSRIVYDRVGPELAASSYSFRTLKDLGLHVSNGTDCPVEYPDPMRGVQCAVTRQPLDGSLPPYRPEEAMSLEAALASYTAESAWASFEEQEKGKIRPGMLADFVILSEDPFAVQADRLSRIRAKAAYLSGECVYKEE